MFVRRAAIKSLVEFAKRKLAEAPIDEQIVIYQALGQAMPKREDRAKAKEIAKTLSRAAALQLDFSNALFTPPKQTKHRHDGDGDGHHGKGDGK